MSGNFNAIVIGSISVVSAKPMILNDSDAWAVANALRAAAMVYSKDAETFRSDGPNPMDRIERQYKDQADQAIRLADAIEGVL